jgi:hypothetical protein
MGVITGYGDDPGMTDNDKLLGIDESGTTKLHPASNINKYLGPGWTLSGDTWTFSSWNSTTKVGVMNTTAGATTKYSIGMWVRFTQATLGIKYAKITGVTTSTVTAIFYNSTQLDNEAISSPVYSTADTPFGVDNSGAWLAWTSTVTAAGGTFTSVAGSGRYILIGKTIVWQLNITITTAGTASGAVLFTLPLAAQNSTMNVGGGREDAISGKLISARLSGSTTQASSSNYDNTSWIANGSIGRLSGTYEAA